MEVGPAHVPGTHLISAGLLKSTAVRSMSAPPARRRCQHQASAWTWAALMRRAFALDVLAGCPPGSSESISRRGRTSRVRWARSGQEFAPNPLGIDATDAEARKE
jgi:hypothetical protein